MDTDSLQTYLQKWEKDTLNSLVKEAATFTGLQAIQHLRAGLAEALNLLLEYDLETSNSPRLADLNARAKLIARTFFIAKEEGGTYAPLPISAFGHGPKTEETLSTPVSGEGPTQIYQECGDGSGDSGEEP